ncbi:hypothetical protein I0C86_19090 [Plantactinospora sp. S1510]|uniref:Uncharacterized protein n=1 Tax=Plantactinospora alkalitolerans TaxID=2789879 RepID=A0ABS0GXY6_9ACTN|nr:hypothetical protein [Plantactinospora alkalitolerans]MBF9131047.1 hypothetical protein [Plantactinospora alkalitolerans]
MSEVTVVTRTVYKEAKKWKQLADKMEPVHSAVRDLDLDATAFFIGDANAAPHSQAYISFQNFCEQALAGGVKEFNQLAHALDTIAEAYDRTDRIVSLDLNKIYTA